MKALLATALPLALLVSACGDSAEVVETDPGIDAEPRVTSVERTPEVVLSEAIADMRRDDVRARDRFRNPTETLEFFELEPGLAVAEIWPGYYADIIAPYLEETGGTYRAVLFPDSAGERFAARNQAFRDKVSDADIYGTVEYGEFGYRDGERLGEIAPAGSLDRIYTFRNVHNWMGGGYADSAFADFYTALKPGGLLGVVEHRLPETRIQDPQGGTGYVQESYMKDLATRAGFEFVGASEVNANPLDTADHPFGVWTLPPSSRTPEEGSSDAEDFDAASYRNIGESDRATLLFRKPG